MDNNNDGFLNRWEFCKALKDFKVGLHPEETELIFSQLASGNNDELNLEDFMSSFLGKFDEVRRGIVEKTFSVLDQNAEGTITVDRLRQSYNSKRHPDVVTGRKTIDEALGEFVSLFDAFHGNRNGQKKELISKQDFIKFFAYMSPMISDDGEFEAVVRCCRANIPSQETPKHISQPLADERRDTVYSRPDSRYGGRGTHRLGVLAPFGVSNETFYNTSYSAYNYPNEKQMENFNSKNKYAAGVTSWPGTHYTDPRKLELEEKHQRVVSQITDTLASRGVSGFLNLLETFQASDPNRSGVVSYRAFQEGRIGLPSFESQ